MVDSALNFGFPERNGSTFGCDIYFAVYYEELLTFTYLPSS